VISLVTFFGSSFKSPTELAKASLGQYITHKQAQEFIQQNHLDRPVAERYVTWLGNLARGDLGTSAITHRRVSTDVKPRLARTLILALVTLVIAVPMVWRPHSGLPADGDDEVTLRSTQGPSWSRPVPSS
jgi:peptide/nickel transport system permease protein